MARAPDSRKLQEWQQRLTRFRRSQRSVADFCRDEKVSLPSFYQWRKKLGRLGPPAKGADEARGFVPVRVLGSASVTVHLRGGTRFDIPTTDPQVLQLAIQTLVQVDAQRLAGGSSC